MLLNIQTTATIATFLVFVSAGTIRFHPNPGCMGPSVQFRGIKPDACCSVGNVYATVKLLDTSDGIVTAWSNGECCGAQSGSAIAGECLAPNFAVMSAKYSAIAPEDDGADVISSNSSSSENCIAPESFTFLDENIEQVFTITHGPP